MRRRNAGSVFWGIALVAIGVLILARNLGYPIPVWNTVARYWPLLIIGWGVLKLIDYFHLRRSGDNRPLFSGGEVALLVLVIFTGSAITAAANIDPDIGRLFDFTDDFDLWDITGNNYNYTEHHEADAPAGSSIEIVNMYGNIEIRPSDVDRITLDVEKTIRASSREEADRRAPEFTFSIRNDGSTFRIASNQDVPVADEPVGPNPASIEGQAEQIVEQVEAPNGQAIPERIEERLNRIPERLRRLERLGGERLRFKSDLVIQVPRQAMLRINNRNGAVRVENLAGDQIINNRYGSVSVRDITGMVQISNGYGSVDIENIDGPLSVETSFDDVAIGNARGTVDVKNRYGEIELSLDQAPQSDITILGEFSDVALELPSNAAFSIVGQTRFGDIESDFEEIQLSRSRGDRSLSGRVGQGGPQIRIETRNGDIRLDRRG
jgi:hypothetical protein